MIKKGGSIIQLLASLALCLLAALLLAGAAAGEVSREGLALRLTIGQESPKSLKEILLSGKDDLIEKRLVSLHGMGKLLVSKSELEEAIGRSKKSVFKGTHNVIRN